jgi:hypothetical protein
MSAFVYATVALILVAAVFLADIIVVANAVAVVTVVVAADAPYDSTTFVVVGCGCVAFCRYFFATTTSLTTTPTTTATKTLAVTVSVPTTVGTTLLANGTPPSAVKTARTPQTTTT